MTDEGRNVKNRIAVGGGDGDGDGGTLHVHSCFSFELQGSVSFFFSNLLPKCLLQCRKIIKTVKRFGLGEAPPSIIDGGGEGGGSLIKV